MYQYLSESFCQQTHSHIYKNKQYCHQRVAFKRQIYFHHATVRAKYIVTVYWTIIADKPTCVSQDIDWSTRGLVNSPTANFL